MYFKHQDINLFYEKYGEKKESIIILPGWGNTRNTWNYLINELKNNYTIYIFDYPSFGNSPPLKEDKTIYDYADAIKYFLEENKIKNPILIAHSFGGRLTAILSGKEQISFQKIILFDVAGIKRRKKLNVLLKELCYKVLKKIIRKKELKEHLLHYFSSSDYQKLPSTMRKTFQNIIKEDLKNYYKKISTPTLIIWGEKDQDTPLKDAYLLKKIIKDSGLIIYQNKTHFSYLENPYDTTIIIKTFLKKEDRN